MPFDSLPISTPAIDLLCRGRTLIIERGLARGRIEDYGKLCAVGGITRQSMISDDTVTIALDYLARAIPAELIAISAWNDAADRTVHDVVATYYSAIHFA